MIPSPYHMPRWKIVALALALAAGTAAAAVLPGAIADANETSNDAANETPEVIASLEIDPEAEPDAAAIPAAAANALRVAIEPPPGLAHPGRALLARVTLANGGAAEATVALLAEEESGTIASWLTPSALKLAAGEERVVRLLLAVPPDAPAGEYRVRVTAGAEGSETAAPVDIDLRVPAMRKTERCLHVVEENGTLVKSTSCEGMPPGRAHRERILPDGSGGSLPIPFPGAVLPPLRIAISHGMACPHHEHEAHGEREDRGAQDVPSTVPAMRGRIGALPPLASEAGLHPFAAAVHAWPMPHPFLRGAPFELPAPAEPVEEIPA